MDQWEYYSLVITWNADQARWEGKGANKVLVGKFTDELLNQLGLDGWELVSVFPDSHVRTNWEGYTAPGGGFISTSPTEWGANRYRAIYKRKRP